LVGCSPDRITDAIEKRKPIIFCAVEFEARAVRRALADFRISPSPGTPGEGWGEGSAPVIHTIGIKAKFLPKQLPNNAVIIMAGLAGGLDPSLKIGDVLIDSLSDISPPELSYPRGLIHTADRIVPTPADRAALFAQTGAQAVDMENAHVRAFAKAFEIPYLGIRAISDCATDTLNPAVARFIDELGRVKPTALARELIRRPKLALELNQLRKASTLAVNNLAAAVRTLVEALTR
jgi:hypothetical protein